MKTRRPGYTLVEVMISIGLLAMAATMFTAMMPMAFRGAQMTGNYQQASSLIQHKIDELRAVGYGRLTYSELQAAGIIDASPTTAPFSFAGVDSLNSIFVSATGTISLADFDANTKQVTVTLTWNGSPVKQGNGTLTAQALVARA